MTAAEYEKRAQECLDMAAQFPPIIRIALLEVSKAWLELAEGALIRERRLDAKQHRPATERLH
jgi:hypothetical protein